MSQRNLITLPGPGGSTISCCIIPCGCLLILLAGVLLGGVGLALRLHHRPSLARTPIATGRERQPAGSALALHIRGGT